MSQELALVISVATEAAVAALVVAALRWGSPWRAAIAAVLGTLATHWVAWQSILDLTLSIGYWPAVGLAEAAVVAVEAIIVVVIVGIGIFRALAVTLAANAASLLLGFALYIVLPD
jgi:hypothetical protein